MKKEEKIKELLLEYVGDNVGADCICDSCEENRKEFMEKLYALLEETN